jgi:excinuclease ABC subunit A
MENFSLLKNNKHTIEVVIDRITIDKTQLNGGELTKTFRSRLSQSIEESLKQAEGFVVANFINDASLSFPDNPTEIEDVLYSEKLACSYCGISVSELEPRMFSFNSPHGACEKCNGLGNILKVDKEKILAPSLTLSEGAVIPFSRMMGSDTWWSRLLKVVVEDGGYDFRKTPYEEMDEKFQNTLLYGSKKIFDVTGENRFGKETTIQEKFEGFITNLERRYEETDSDYIRKEIEQFMQKETCSDCHGARLREEALSVHIDGKNIAQMTGLPIQKSMDWAAFLKDDPKSPLSKTEKIIAESILKEIVTRLSFLVSVGLNYLTLNREASTLAGGEAQRIRLASQIGTGLTGVLYILDEPTIGLHQRDNHRLIETLKNLRDKGNSVLVVEHDRDIMLAADEILDFGPKAGKHGGQIVAQATPEGLQKNTNSITGKYLSRKKDVVRKDQPDEFSIITDDSQRASGQIRITGASAHNLKNVDVEFPLSKFTAITGISGSGKSTILHDTLYHNLAKHLGKVSSDKPGPIEQIMVPDAVKKVILIDQSPIGKTPRSNPATYTKVFDYIRKLYENTQDARIRGYKAGRFSFNVKGGRCEACQGDGQLKIEMQFLPDVYVKCDVCNGDRYNEETLQVEYKGKNIAQVLKLSIDDAYDFFASHGTLRSKLKTLKDVGLGYVELGQPAPTLSGGEAQRVKLAKELSGRTHEHVVYLLDEPTTGLHFEDVQKLLNILHQLVKNNNSVIVIEHNLDIIKNADWIIDVGPEGGEYGGEIIAIGTPQQIAANTNSFTGGYLAAELKLSKK